MKRATLASGARVGRIVLRAGQLALADAGYAGLTLPRISVYTNDFDPDENSLYAAFTRPTFAGYANATVIISAPYVSQPDDKVAAATDLAVFSGAAADDGQMVFGWFLFDNVTHDVWAAGRFESGPKSLVTHLARIAMTVELLLDTGVDVMLDT